MMTRISPASFPAIRALKSERPATTRVRGFGGLTGQSAGPIAFSPDGRLLAAVKVSGRSEMVEVRDVSSGQVRAVLDPSLPVPNGGFSPQNIRFSPDARTFGPGGYWGVHRSLHESKSGTSPGHHRAWDSRTVGKLHAGWLQGSHRPVGCRLALGPSVAQQQRGRGLRRAHADRLGSISWRPECTR